MGAIRSKYLEVHNEYMKKVQEYDTLYGEHARISQVNITPFVMFVSVLIVLYRVSDTSVA